MSARRIGTVIDGLHIRLDGPPAARPVLLIHGFGCSMHAMDRLAFLLADSYRVIRVDLFGHGHSASRPDLDAPAQARAIATVLTKLNLSNVVAVGHSFGADVAVELATTTGTVTACVVIGQAPDYSYSKLPPGALVQFLPSKLYSLTPTPLLRFGGRTAFAPGYRMSSDDPERFVRDLAEVDPAMYRVVLVTRPRRLAKRPLDKVLQDAAVPALAIHGDHDQMWDWRRTLARYEAAGISVATVDGAGHSPNIERPASVAQLIREFVN